MKNRSLFILLLISQLASAQVIKSRLDLVAGLSVREFAHFGLKYQYADMTQLSFTIGGDLEMKYEENITTFGIDHQVHFGKLSYYSNRPVWYNRHGFTMLKDAIGDYELVKYTYFNFGMGREVAFSERLGVNFDLGLAVQFRKKQLKPKLETPLDTRIFSFPLARIQFFLSF
jgi:hypothetical protein